MIGLPFWSSVAAVKVWVPPTTTDAVAGETVILVNTGVGGGVTAVTVAVAVPLTDPLAAVIVAVPAAFAVNLPVESIVPTVVLLLVHVTVAVIGLPFWSSVAAVKVWVPPTTTDAVAGETVILVNTGGGVAPGGAPIAVNAAVGSEAWLGWFEKLVP
ncbi:Uncharacterised protein [uncultured archaeon]|nr:Uncharacterised protein [uncultured archaeon]